MGHLEMIIKLLPDQISKGWDYIRLGVMQTASPIMDVRPEAMQNIFRSLLLGTMQCWAVVKKTTDNPNDVYGFIITSVVNDQVSASKTLNIYAVYAFKTVDSMLMKDAISSLNEFAKSNGCKRLTAYTNIEKVVELSKSVGFSVTAQLLTKEVV